MRHVCHINASPVDNSHNIGVQLLNENREEYSQNVQQYQLVIEQSAFCVVFIKKRNF